MKILTLSQIVRECKKLDPNSAINTAMLNRLISDKKINYGSIGNRTVLEWHTLITCLNELLGFSDESFFPQIRTIRKAAEELKYSASDIGVAEKHIFLACHWHKMYVSMRNLKPKHSLTNLHASE